MSNKNYFVKKLDEDDILEILLEYFLEIDRTNTPLSRGILLGKPGDNLRFVGVYGEEDDLEFMELSLEEIDGNYEFNGTHSFLKNNPTFYICKDLDEKE